MADETLSSTYKKDNLRLLRRRLRMTQQEFISRFLTDPDGKAMISVATLSVLESRGMGRINEVILTVSEKLGIDSMVFSIRPEAFTEKITVLLPADTGQTIPANAVSRRSGIDQLLSRLTMYLGEELYEGRLHRGDKIESDRILAAKMQVGRSAIREALKVLDVLGMIDIVPGQGTFISESEKHFFEIPLSWSLFLSNSQIGEIVEVRNLLEVKAAQKAAENRSEQALIELTEISSDIQKAYIEHDIRKMTESDTRFHNCIAKSSGNPLIYSMVRTISSLMWQFRGSGMTDESLLKAIFQEHQKIYGFIVAGDSKGAGEAMQEHLDQSLVRYDIGH